MMIFKKCLNTQILIFGLLYFVTTTACNKNKSGVKQIKDHGLTMMVMRTKSPANDGITVNYSARLVPEKGLCSTDDQAVKTKMWYAIDSCFYLQAGKKKIYANITQPIANGVAGSFEYLLSFDVADINNGEWSLVYNDKYLNRRTYKIAL